MKNLLFKKVRCRGFYTKVHDGNYLVLDTHNLVADHYNSGVAEPIEKDVDMVEKIYYEHRNQNFNGVIVGTKKLIISGYLDVCYDDPVDVGIGTIPERFYFSKRAKEVKNVYIVYYANNLKHFVDEDDIIGEECE